MEFFISYGKEQQSDHPLFCVVRIDSYGEQSGYVLEQGVALVVLQDSEDQDIGFMMANEVALHMLRFGIDEKIEEELGFKPVGFRFVALNENGAQTIFYREPKAPITSKSGRENDLVKVDMTPTSNKPISSHTLQPIVTKSNFKGGPAQQHAYLFVNGAHSHNQIQQILMGYPTRLPGLN